MCHHIERGVAYEEAEEHAEHAEEDVHVEQEGASVNAEGEVEGEHQRPLVPNADD